MVRIIKDNAIRLIIGICVIVFIPIGVWWLSTVHMFTSLSNDWVGFWGSYIGAIVGACVSMYVLIKTLNDNKRAEKRKEIVDYCDCLIEKSSIFAQKYEEALYEAHTYLAIYENDSASAEKKFGMYKQFIASHHSAKAILYEIENYFAARKDNSMFYTPRIEEVMKSMDKAYEVFKDFESEVGKASRAIEVDDKRLITVVEEFLNILNQYEKELLDEKTKKCELQMKSLKEIYRDTEKNMNINQKDAIAKHYMDELNKEINGDIAKLLVYKEECIKLVDINVPTFWMSALAVVLAVLSAMLTVFVQEAGVLQLNTIIEVLGMFIVILIVPILFYTIVVKTRNKYLLMELVINKIEHDFHEK